MTLASLPLPDWARGRPPIDGFLVIAGGMALEQRLELSLQRTSTAQAFVSKSDIVMSYDIPKSSIPGF